MGTIYDHETAGNFPNGSDQEGGRVIQLFAEQDMDEELLDLARAVGVDYEDDTEAHSDGFDGEVIDPEEQKRAALKLAAAAGFFGAIAIGQAIVRGPLPF